MTLEQAEKIAHAYNNLKNYCDDEAITTVWTASFPERLTKNTLRLIEAYMAGIQDSMMHLMPPRPDFMSDENADVDLTSLTDKQK